MCVAVISAPSSAARGKKRARIACAAGRSCSNRKLTSDRCRVDDREEHVGDHDEALTGVLDAHPDMAGRVTGEVHDLDPRIIPGSPSTACSLG